MQCPDCGTQIARGLGYWYCPNKRCIPSRPAGDAREEVGDGPDRNPSGAGDPFRRHA